MKLYSLRTEQRLPLAIGEAWDFFSNPANLQEITPPAMRFEVTSEVPSRMHPGLIVTYRVRPLLGVPVRWVTEITHLVEPYLFVDEQRFGPYRFWHHQHHFREIEGGVEMVDLVHYAPPTPAAPLLDRLLIGGKLKQIFDFRREVLVRRFGELP